MRKLNLILLTIVGVASAQASGTYHGSHGTYHSSGGNYHGGYHAGYHGGGSRYYRGGGSRYYGGGGSRYYGGGYWHGQYYSQGYYPGNSPFFVGIPFPIPILVPGFY
jgi:hypothetical protein